VLLIVPIGVGAAIYLEEYADKGRWWNRLIELNIQNLAGVPSIVFGILGLAFIVRGPISLGFVAAAGSMTLALLVLPTVILAAREAIRAVPPSIRGPRWRWAPRPGRRPSARCCPPPCPAS
jgi:phosphate transport system permease protein